MADTYQDLPDDIKATAGGIVDSFYADPALIEGAIAAALDNERNGHARALSIAIDALTHIAAFHDEQAQAHLNQHSSFSNFDEPVAARAARVALLEINAPSALRKVN